MKQLLVLFFLLCSVTAWAQDVIVKKDGSTVICRIVEVNATEIVYKKWSDRNGSNYIMDRSLASAINYENGKRETLGEVQNQYQPHNQNDGVQQYNDRALLEIASQTGQLKKRKARNFIRWTGGSLLGALGVVYIIMGFAGDFEDYEYVRDDSWAGYHYAEVKHTGNQLLCLGAGATLSGLGTWLLCSAAKHQKQIKALQNYSILEQEFKLGNGKTLTPSVDIISDQALNTPTFGLGLRYNF